MSKPSTQAMSKGNRRSSPSAVSTAKKGPAKAGSVAANQRRKTGAGSRNKAYDELFEQGTTVAKTVKTVKPTRKPTSKPNSKPSGSHTNKGKRKKNKKLKWYQIIFRSFTIFVCLLFAWCLFAYYSVISYEQKPLVKADAGIILGAALWNNQPSPALKERLEHAITLYEEGLVDYLILSGGSANSARGITEAEGMKNYLVAANIPEERLLLESQSQDTYENLLYSKRVLERSQLNTVIIISHNYHVKRAEEIAKFVDYSYVQTAGVQTKVLNESYNYTREMLAYSKWQLNKLLIPLGLNI